MLWLRDGGGFYNNTPEPVSSVGSVRAARFAAHCSWCSLPEAIPHAEWETFKGAMPSWLLPCILIQSDGVFAIFLSARGRSSKRLCLPFWLPFQTEQLSLGCSLAPPLSRKLVSFFFPPPHQKKFLRIILKAGGGSICSMRQDRISQPLAVGSLCQCPAWG